MSVIAAPVPRVLQHLPDDGDVLLQSRAADSGRWDDDSWLSDALRHVAYGAVTDAILHALDRS